MKFTQENETGFTSMLLINPWEFQGLGGKEGEEYWVLGAQFLQNYYTIYDFGKKQIGLVESKSSVIGKSPELKPEENPFHLEAGDNKEDFDPEKKIKEKGDKAWDSVNGKKLQKGGAFKELKN